MSACPSSPIAVLTSHLGSEADPGGASDGERAADLLAALKAVSDPRRSRGVRHRLVTVLAVAVCAVLAGARSYVAIREWAADLPVTARVRLGMGRVTPSESTFRRLLQTVNTDELDQALSGWIAHHVTAQAAGVQAGGAQAGGGRVVRAIVVDGKTVRGARTDGGRAVHLLAALEHGSGVVLAQTRVDTKTNEITAFGPLVERVAGIGVDLTGVVITADALHTQHRHAHDLRGHGAHYVFIVKDNQPSLHTQLAGLPWRQIPLAHTSYDRGHGRIETRTLQLTAIHGPAGAGIEFPHAQLAVRVTRRRRPLTSNGRWSTETVHAITSLGFADLHPHQLAEIIRGQWRIENQLHWVRDVSYAEDHSQIRTGTGPATMAVLRNFAISRHRLAGATNIAHACRTTNRHPLRALDLLT